MRINQEQMAAHVELLAEQIGVTINTSSAGGRAVIQDRVIEIRPVRSPITYAIALHELGHIAIGHRSMKIGRLAEEGEAWAWARDNALVWTDTMDAKARKCVTSYFRSYDRPSRRNRTRWPEPNDPVWAWTDYRPSIAA